jgi:hypothetical protein
LSSDPAFDRTRERRLPGQSSPNPHWGSRRPLRLTLRVDRLAGERAGHGACSTKDGRPMTKLVAKDHLMLFVQAELDRG